MTGLSKRFWADEKGATAIEYGLLAAILGMGIVYSLTNFQIALTGLFKVVEGQVPDVSSD
jgi:pilus assembly protein Flp/PilA